MFLDQFVIYKISENKECKHFESPRIYKLCELSFWLDQKRKSVRNISIKVKQLVRQNSRYQRKLEVGDNSVRTQLLNITVICHKQR